jgi:hypothetical protein
VHRKPFVSLALVAPVTLVILTAAPAGALSVPTVPVSPAPVPPVALSPLPLPPPPLPALPLAPLPAATSPVATLPAVTLPAPPLPLSDVTDTVVDLLAPPAAPVVPSAPPPATLGLPPIGSTLARTATASTSGTGAGLQGPSTARVPDSTGRASASAMGVARKVANAPARRVAARRGLRAEAPDPTTRSRDRFFGWFGLFTAITGRDILRMLHLGLAALCVGLVSMVAARVLRPA